MVKKKNLSNFALEIKLIYLYKTSLQITTHDSTRITNNYFTLIIKQLKLICIILLL